MTATFELSMLKTTTGQNLGRIRLKMAKLDLWDTFLWDTFDLWDSFLTENFSVPQILWDSGTHKGLIDRAITILEKHLLVCRTGPCHLF